MPCIIFIFFLSVLLVLIPVLVNVAFFTLIERKVLGLSQRRKGPNKVSFWGIIQPISDALKLFSKEITIPYLRWKNSFYVAPVLSLIISLILWRVLTWQRRESEYVYRRILILAILRLGLYPLLLAGWRSIRAYASIGAIRGIAQTISYEIRIALFLLRHLSALSWLGFGELAHFQSKQALFLLAPVLLGWLICCIAETNRTPFDFAEGESELVSGFNIEYGGGLFASIFMAEYSSILGLSTLNAILFRGSNLSLFTLIMRLRFAIFWVWVRSTLPRYRYDKLINLAWVSLLPLSLGLLIVYF